MRPVKIKDSLLRNYSAADSSLCRYAERFVSIILSLLLILFSFPLLSFAAEGTFTPTGNMNSARRGHTATLLQNGKVLIAGGLNTSSNTVNTAEIYDPATGIFTPTGNMNSVRNSHTATLLPNGKVLIAGGSTYSTTLNTAEIYDPATGFFTPTGNLNSKRVFQTATLLPNGRVLIVGGWNDSVYTTSAELYDLTTGTFTPTGSMNTTIARHRATFLQNGKVLITGYGNPAQIYDPTTGTFTSTGNMSGWRERSTATLLTDGKVLITGGWRNNYLNSAEIYDPTTGTFTPTGNMNSGRVDHEATLLPTNGKVLISGGHTQDYGAGTLNSAEIYDPLTGIFTPTRNMGYARTAHTATLLSNGKVLVAGGAEGLYTAINHSSAEMYTPPTNSKIAFSSNRDGNSEIYVMNPDGTNQTRLTNNPTDDSGPSWSPDGSKIAFQSDRDGNYEIYVMNADGTNQVRLTSNTATDFQPAWSPDGSKIAFRTYRDGNSEVYVMNADGTNPVNLTNHPDNYDGEPRWSPDGTKIAFSSWRSGVAGIWVMNADGSNPVQLTGSWTHGPSWSPDGTKIAYSGYGNIFVMNADGSNQHSILNVGCCISPYVGSWSPDGSKMVIFSDRFDGNFEIYTINSDGTNRTRLTNNSAFDMSPSWSPILSLFQLQPGVIQLPQTGQTTCYDSAGAVIPCAGTGQDGDMRAGVAWPSPRLTDIGDGTVTDNLTGLMWTKDANLPGVSMTWQQALDYVKGMNAGTYDNFGHTDWRLPNRKELESLIDRNRFNPVLPVESPFTNVQGFFYWSSTTYPYYGNGSWAVWMESGREYAYLKSYSIYVWPVRFGQNGTIQLPQTGQTTCYDSAGAVIPCAGTGQDGDMRAGVAWPSPRLTDIGDGTVTDNLTGLMWTKDANLPGVSMTWQQALDYVKGMNAGTYDNFGHTDWRLPNVNELESLIDADKYGPVLPTGHHFIDVYNFDYFECRGYWSSTSSAYQSDHRAWLISLGDGHTDTGEDCRRFVGVWPVRGGQIGSAGTIYADSDADGYASDVDCNDSNPNIHPGASDICNNINDNCDNQIDEGFPNLNTFCSAGNGPCISSGSYVCSADGTGTVCSAVAEQPSPEVCDQIDNDCDGVVDEGVTTTFYRDQDGDGYGDLSQTVEACVVPMGYSFNPGDCNDGDNTVYPGATEIPNDGIDQNCDKKDLIIGTPGSNTNPQMTFVDPVSTGSGNYFYQSTDFVIPGRGLPLVFQRSYNSQDNYSGPLGANWTHSYNIFLNQLPNGNVVIRWGDGHGETFKWDGTDYTPQTGVYSLLTKNPDGTFVLTRKDQSGYILSSSGKLNSIQDKNGNSITLTYNSSGNLIAITDTVGRNLTLSYNAQNRIAQITDPIGRTITFLYDANNDLIQVSDPAGNITRYAYDAFHRVTSIILPRGDYLLQNAYDIDGRVISQANGRGHTSTFTYDTPNPGDTTITNARGNHLIHTYDTSFRITKVTDSLGSVTQFAYDSNNNRTGITNQNGNATQFVYDIKGNILNITDPLLNTITFIYDAYNRLTSATNARGYTTTFAYDGNGNLIGIQDAIGNTTVFAYDSFGQLISKKDAKGNISTFGYDSFGNLILVTDPLGSNTSLDYDSIGRLVSLTDPNGNTAIASYDLLSRLVTITDPLGNQTQFIYDPVGNLVTIVDAKGNTINYGYDAVNNLVNVKDALGNITRYEYDENNNRVAITNAKGNTTSYSYDSLNRLVTITDPLSFVTSYTYDVVGNVTALADPNGSTSQFTYDALNRLTAILYANGSTVNYTYDVNGNRTRMIDSQGTTSYEYDSLDRLRRIVHPGNKVVSYAYDTLGNRESITYPDGKMINYSYDQGNRLSKVINWLGRVTAYNYDPASNLIKVAYPNQAGISYGYDAANRLVEVINNYRGSNNDDDDDSDANPISRFAYLLDTLGNRVQVTDGSAKVTKYGYDALSRLTSVIYNDDDEEDGEEDKVITYTYDAVGNRLTMTGPGESIAYTYDAADRLLTAGKVIFTYDANGNRITKTEDDEIVTYGYDAAKRLVLVTEEDEVISTYIYDGDGNRIGQISEDGIYTFLNDIATTLPVVLQESGPDGDISYTYGLSLISSISPEFSYFYHYDGLGSVVGLTDPKGHLKGRYVYDAWGNTIKDIPDDRMGTRNKFRFTGEPVQPEIELYYLRTRFYDPIVGRFISKDRFGGMIKRPQMLNGYTYVLNNPVTLIDPSGLFAITNVLYESIDLTKSIGKEIGIDFVVGAAKGAKFAYQKYGEIGLILSGAEGGIAGKLGGWNIINSVKSGVADFVSKKILKLIISNGGRTEVSDVPWLSEIPGLGILLFSNVPATGEIIDESGNVYDQQGNIIGNIYNNAYVSQTQK